MNADQEALRRRITVEDYVCGGEARELADELLAASGYTNEDCLEIAWYGQVPVGLFLARDADGQVVLGADEVETVEHVLVRR